LVRLAGAIREKRSGNAPVRSLLVHQAPLEGSRIRAIAPGVHALPWREYLLETLRTGR
jgi:hypothetical protein